MTTPPNPSGFNRKPTPKFRKPARGRKHPGKRKADISHSQLSQEFIALYGACRLLMCVAIILGPALIGNSETVKSQPAE